MTCSLSCPVPLHADDYPRLKGFAMPIQNADSTLGAGEAADCSSPPPSQLLQAVEELNAGAYFVCHETLEALWLEEKRPVRNLYKGILQLAAALLQQQRGNDRATVSLLTKACLYLKPFSPVCQRVHVARLIGDAETLRQDIGDSGPGFHRPPDLYNSLQVHLITEPPPSDE